MYESGRAFFPQWSGIAIFTRVCAAEYPAHKNHFPLAQIGTYQKLGRTSQKTQVKMLPLV